MASKVKIMNIKLLALGTALMLLKSCTPAFSEGNTQRVVLYSARYYLKPHSVVSHYHLYSIWEDGTHRIQLTFGSGDDTYPVVSPNKKFVVFTRSTKIRPSKDPWSTESLFILNTSTRKSGFFLKPPLGDYFDYKWSPNSDQVFISYDPKDDSEFKFIESYSLQGKTIETMKNRKDILFSPSNKFSLNIERDNQASLYSETKQRVASLPKWLLNPAWFGDDLIVGGVESQKPLESKPLQICIFNSHGKESKRVDLDFSETPSYEKGDAIRLYSAVPRHHNLITLGVYQHSSSSGSSYDFYLADLTSGKVQALFNAQFMIWSREGDVFLSAPPRNLDDYDIKKKQVVWVSRLSLYDVRGKLIRVLTPRLVSTGGSDWLK